MKTTGEFRVCQHRIAVRWNEPITIMPFGDIHRNSDMCSEDRWKEFISYARTKKNTYFLGMGDYLDSVSTSERAIVGDGGLHDSTINRFEKMVQEDVENLAREIEFMKPNLLGLYGGNHYYSLRSGMTSDHMLAGLLKTTFLGVCGFVRLVLCQGNYSMTYDIFSHHGRGGGRRAGASINQVEDLSQVAEADLLLMGHNHQLGAVPISRLSLIKGARGLRVRERTTYLVRTGSFLRAYVEGRPSYIVDSALRPCVLGLPEIQITCRRVASGNRELKVETRVLT